jgi:hypothetical protein
MSETKWKKNIKFDEKKEDIAETSVVEGMDNENIDEIREIEKKIRRINSKKKGFTKLPHLESVYDPDSDLEPENFEENLEEENEPIEPFVEGAKGRKKSKSKSKSKPTSKPRPKPKPLPTKETQDTVKKMADALIYISLLPSNMSFLIADGLYKVSHVKRPMSKDDNDYKNLAGMIQRVLTGLIGIFITYNLYFLYSSPEVPSLIDTIIKPKPADAPPDIATTVIDGALPLKIALTPLRILMYAFEKSFPLIKQIPFKALLFVLSGIATYYFLTKGGSDYFVKMFGNSFKLFTDPKGYKLNTSTTIIIAIAMIYEISMIIVKYKTAVFADPRLILGWIVFFGVALGLVFIAEFIIPLFIFYITMLCMMDNKESPFNFPKVMSDINKSFIGDSDDIYECPEAGTDLEKFISRFNKIFGKVILENIHIWVLIPIIIYNIHTSRYDGPEGFTEGARGFSAKGFSPGARAGTFRMTGTGTAPIKSSGLRRAHFLTGFGSIFMLLMTNDVFLKYAKMYFTQKEIVP